MWKRDELDRYLRGSWLRDRTIADMAGIEGDYQDIFTKLSKFYPNIFLQSLYSFEEFKWAWSVIWSRSFWLDSPRTQQSDSYLVPMADILNHSPDAKTFYGFDEFTGDFLMKVGDSYKKGQQVYNNYVPRPNNDLLRTYGFVLKNNNLNHVKLNASLGDPVTTKHFTEKEEFLIDNNKLSNPYPYSSELYIEDNGKVSEQLIYLLRVKHFDAVVNFKAALKRINPLEKLEDKHAEMKVLDEIISLCEETLASYSSNSEGTSEGEKSVRHQMALQIVSEEKEILQNTITTMGNHRTKLSLSMK